LPQAKKYISWTRGELILFIIALIYFIPYT
jgi:hypothetical protein